MSSLKKPGTGRKGAAMREAILDAACRAIVERGVEAVRMRDIAAAAGVSPTLPHYYFNTRSELLREAFVHAEEAMVRLELEVAGDRPARERLDRLLLVYFDADPRVYEIWMLAREMTTRAIREPGLRDSHEDVYAFWSRTIADVIRDGQAAGDVAPDIDADQSGWRLTALVEGLGTWLLTGMATRRQCRELVRDSVARELGE
ncbi:MAG TPA: TetR family transcriptional regulator C-terminal domain-containing protein [Gaiellales bacterium]|nr:TetR family transcriptional regulator C-terminal domain-containing protein [Gaiellales bacterium]